MHTRHPLRMRVASLCWLATAFSLFLAAPSISRAGGLQASPILLEFGNTQKSQTLWLTNTGEHPLRAQIRVQQWTQFDQEDRLQPSNALLASPPLVEIAAGQKQLVRVVQAAAPGTNANEAAFRLIVDELPGGAETVTSGLQFLLSYSIPAFVLPPGSVPQLERQGPYIPTDAQLLQGHWNVQGKKATLTVRNTGNQRIRISQLSWVTTAGERMDIAPGLFGYVLAGQQMRWTHTLPSPLPANGTLSAKLNDDPEPQALPQITTGP
ncbi:MAG: fimbrial biogenesis chaperone [Stenotrophomonas sp.]|uniref:fimbrial biogenesis chaperone n=1 Tax=Stenotrophomonas sp. TaxID=69392 RepID=UPI003D6CF35B